MFVFLKALSSQIKGQIGLRPDSDTMDPGHDYKPQNKNESLNENWFCRSLCPPPFCMLQNAD